MIQLDSIKEELTEYFIEIVDIINKLVELRSGNFVSMLEINTFLENSAKSFMEDTGILIAKISGDLNKRIMSLDIETMKNEIEEASSTFLQITDDLELLSYNTICRTMSLGTKGSTIAHISKEIKQNSVDAKQLLEDIRGTFTLIFDDFSTINQTFSNNSSKVEKMVVQNDTSSSPLEVSSDISRLIEYSQFHDIIIQEIDAIDNAVNSSSDDGAFAMGHKYGVYELAVVKMQDVTNKIIEVFAEIKDIIKEFLYHINTDIQNIIGRANLVRMEFEQAKDYSSSIENIVSGLMDMISETEKELKNAGTGITALRKFGKSFRNLVVITAVEVARIGDLSLDSVVSSMSRTEHVLAELVDKLTKSLKMWGGLKSEFVDVLHDADTTISRLRELHTDKEVGALLGKSAELDDELSFFRSKFSGDEFMEHLAAALENVTNSFYMINKLLANNYEHYKRQIPERIYNDPEFDKGKASATIMDIMAHEDDHSSIEFF
jgi:hypothetical protein